MKKIISLAVCVFLANLIFLVHAPFADAKFWKCEEVFGFSSLHKSIIFYDSDIGVCFGDESAKYGKNEKNYTIENVFAGADVGSSFIVLAGFIREIDGKNFLTPNAFLLQKQQDGAMRGWHFFIPDGLRKPVRKFLPDVKAREIHYAFNNRLVMLFAKAEWISESTDETELNAVLMPYFKYISETTSVECEDNKEKDT